MKKGLLFVSLFLFSAFFILSTNVNAANETNGTIPGNGTNVTTGNLYVSVTPEGASIYVNGIYKGLSPITIYNLNVGTPTVMIQKVGYQTAYRYPTISAGLTTPLYVILTQNSNGTNGNNTNQTTYGMLNITSSPTGASISVDGINKGISPLFLSNIITGTHTVTATKSGYNSASAYPVVSTNLVTNVNLILTQIPPTVTYNCAETDQGLDYGTQGTTTITSSTQGVIDTKTDYCATGNSLREYYCSSPSAQYISLKNQTCNRGCEAGACKNLAYASPISNNWIIGIIAIIVICFLIVFWAKKKGHIKEPKIPVVQQSATQPVVAQK